MNYITLGTAEFQPLLTLESIKNTAQSIALILSAFAITLIACMIAKAVIERNFIEDFLGKATVISLTTSGAIATYMVIKGFITGEWHAISFVVLAVIEIVILLIIKKKRF